MPDVAASTEFGQGISTLPHPIARSGFNKFASIPPCLFNAMGDRKPSFRLWPSRRPLPNRTQRRPLPKSGETTDVGTASSSSSSGPLETEDGKNEAPPPDSGGVVPVDDASVVPVNQPSPSPVTDEAIQPPTESDRTDGDMVSDPNPKIPEGSDEGSKHVSEIQEEKKKSDPNEEEKKLNHTEANGNGNGGTRGINVITLAGDNRGASMEMGYSTSSRKDKPIHIHRAYKKKPIPTVQEQQEEDAKKPEEEDQQPPLGTCVNNNAQGINNSIVCNGSISGGNPGVYMFLAHESKRAAAAGVDMRKLNNSKPTIRRRCLRAFFMELDDDSDPGKPRRHACRACNQRYERTI